MNALQDLHRNAYERERTREFCWSCNICPLTTLGYFAIKINANKTLNCVNIDKHTI